MESLEIIKYLAFTVTGLIGLNILVKLEKKLNDYELTKCNGILPDYPLPKVVLNDVKKENLVSFIENDVEFVKYPLKITGNLSLWKQQIVNIPSDWLEYKDILEMLSVFSAKEDVDTMNEVLILRYFTLLLSLILQNHYLSNQIILSLFLNYGTGMFGIGVKKFMLHWAHTYLKLYYGKRYYPKEEEMVEPFFEDDKFGWLAFNIIDKFERFFDEFNY